MIRNNQLEEKLKYDGSYSEPTHIHLCTYNTSSVSQSDMLGFDEVKTHLLPDGVNWIQVHGLKDVPVIEEICAHFGIDFLTAQDILNTNHLTKIECHDDYNLVIVKLFLTDESGEWIPHQISLIQTKSVVLTFVDRNTEFFSGIYTAINKNATKIRGKKTDFLLSVILNNIMINYKMMLSKIEDELEDMEEKMLECIGTDEVRIGEIQMHRRELRVIRKTLLPLKEQMPSLMRKENALIGKTALPYFQDVNDHLLFVMQTLDTCREMITALLDLYLSNNDQRMNNIMKQLTVVSTLFIPLTFFAGIWGMNFKGMPELDWKYGYLGAWCLMIAVTVIVFIYFKRKKWY